MFACLSFVVQKWSLFFLIQFRHIRHLYNSLKRRLNLFALSVQDLRTHMPPPLRVVEAPSPELVPLREVVALTACLAVHHRSGLTGLEKLMLWM